MWIWLSELWFLLGYMASRSSFPQPLSGDEERRALLELHPDGLDVPFDPRNLTPTQQSARRRLIEHNLRLVAHIAKKYSVPGGRNTVAPGCDVDDLISIGTIGLIKAVDTFRPGAGVQLSTYAARCAENEVLMILRSNRKRQRDVSLNDPIGSDSEGNEITVMDTLGSSQDNIEEQVHAAMEMARALRLIASLLTPRERVVIEMRYGLRDRICRPQHEVARALGISRSYVSRIEKKALAIIKERFSEEPGGGN